LHVLDGAAVGVVVRIRAGRVTDRSVSEGYSAPLLVSECDLGQAVTREGWSRVKDLEFF
jgi:hypothetical protein